MNFQFHTSTDSEEIRLPILSTKSSQSSLKTSTKFFKSSRKETSLLVLPSSHSLLEPLHPAILPGVRQRAHKEIHQGPEHQIVPKVNERSPGHADPRMGLVKELGGGEVPHGPDEQGAGIDEIPHKDGQKGLGGQGVAVPLVVFEDQGQGRDGREQGDP